MKDYIEWMLEEQGEERETEGIPLPRWGTPLGKGGKWGREDEGTAGARNPPVGFANSPLSKGAKGTEGNPQVQRKGDDSLWEESQWERRPDEVIGPYRRRVAASGAAALREKMRRTETVAGYRAGAPTAWEVPERTGTRERSLTELDGAFRRDARRFDGGFTLF